MTGKPLCPGCGAESIGLCSNCYLEGHPVAFRDFSLRVCECGLVDSGMGFSDSMEDVLRDKLGKALMLPDKVVGAKIDFSYGIEDRIVEVDAVVSASISGREISSRCDIKVPVEKVVCPDCQKYFSGYYEAVLQVRDPDFDYEFREDKINDKQRVRGGWDFYVVDHGYARRVVQELENQGYVIIKSKKLYGVKDGREVNRFFYSIKKPGFDEGDFLRLDGRIYRVASLGREVVLKELASGNKLKRRLDAVLEAEVAAKREDVHEAIVTESTPTNLQIMDSETYELHDFKPRIEVGAGNTIGLVYIDESCLLVD